MNAKEEIFEMLAQYFKNESYGILLQSSLVYLSVRYTFLWRELWKESVWFYIQFL